MDDTTELIHKINSTWLNDLLTDIVREAKRAKGKFTVIHRIKYKNILLRYFLSKKVLPDIFNSYIYSVNTLYDTRLNGLYAVIVILPDKLDIIGNDIKLDAGISLKDYLNIRNLTGEIKSSWHTFGIELNNKQYVKLDIAIKTEEVNFVFKFPLSCIE